MKPDDLWDVPPLASSNAPPSTPKVPRSECRICTPPPITPDSLYERCRVSCECGIELSAEIPRCPEHPDARRLLRGRNGGMTMPHCWTDHGD
jgi:hypothetical protein